MAKKEFDIDNERELREMRQKYSAGRYLNGKNVKPYFFGHIDKVKGFYNEDKKMYVKYDTSMDYLREILESYRPPKFEDDAKPLTNIIINVYNHDTEDRKQIGRILYCIEQFKKSRYYIWNGYADNSDKYRIYLEEENKVIETINSLKINYSTFYSLLKNLDSGELSDFLSKILFNIGNETAFNLIKKSKNVVGMIEEDPNGDICIYGINYKKSQK